MEEKNKKQSSKNLPKIPVKPKVMEKLKKGKRRASVKNEVDHTWSSYLLKLQDFYDKHKKEEKGAVKKKKGGKTE